MQPAICFRKIRKWVIVQTILNQLKIKADVIETKTLNLPNTQAGMVYSVEDEKLKACTTVTLLGYPTKIGEIELRGGYVIDKQPMGAVCLRIGDLSQFGFNMPLHHLINVSVGGYVGYMFERYL